VATSVVQGPSVFCRMTSALAAGVLSRGSVSGKRVDRQQPRAALSSGDNIAAARDDEIGCVKQPVRENAKPGQQPARFVIIESRLDAK
jgi:hypothetical protein